MTFEEAIFQIQRLTEISEADTARTAALIKEVQRLEAALERLQELVKNLETLEYFFPCATLAPNAAMRKTKRQAPSDFLGLDNRVILTLPAK